MHGRWERQVLAENFRLLETESWRQAGGRWCPRCCSSPSFGCSCCSCPSCGLPALLASAGVLGVPEDQMGTVRLSLPEFYRLLSWVLSVSLGDTT